ncbi:MAG: ABC transporter ATP-binding protein [Clostridiaceae bacterium]|nr:ABC transporter ATP-binding protein [Clostridiaceae bacterium]
MSNVVLKTEGISKSFGGVKAVQQFSMELHEHEIKGIIGPNGAGKTTIFNLLSHIILPDEGKIFLLGEDIENKSQEEVAQMGLSRTFQSIRLFAGLNVLDNVKVGLDNEGKYNLFDAMFLTPRRWKEEKRIHNAAMECLTMLNLEKYKDYRSNNLPYGIQRRVEIARAIVSRPKILLLDEPAAGLLPEEVFELIDFIRLIKEKFELSIIVIEHRMDLIMNLCSEILVQDFGKTIACGTPKELQCDPRVLAAYLGEEE